MLMTVILLAGSMGFAGAVQAEEETPTLPKVVLSAVNVTDDGTATGNATGYLELSLLVQAENFQTAGVVLSYDTAVLTPVDWSTPETKPTLTENWTTVIPTKGADNFSGKPALARLAEGTSATRGYLYLGAESLRYQDLSAEATRLVTVRFKIAPDGADYKPVSVPGTSTELTDETNKTLCLAPDAVANDAIPGAQAMLTLGEEAVAEASELNPDAQEGYVLKCYVCRTTLGASETACTVTFESKNGASINTGSTVVGGGDYAITFFDWDGRVIDAISAPENATATVDAWQAHTAIDARLNNTKTGYTFETWIVVQQVDEKLVSAHKDLTSRKSTTGLTPVDAADFTDLSQYVTDPSRSVLVQAAYKTTSAVNSGNGDGGNLNDDTARYKFGTPSFYQYGTSADADNGQYAVRVPVTRGSVLRADEPVIYAVVTTSSGAVIEKVTLENTDVTQFEVVVPKITVSVTYMVLDSYGEDAWTMGLQRSQEGRQAKNTIIKEGAFALLVNEGWLYKDNDWNLTKTPVNDVCFRDAGYTKVTASNLRNAMKALSDASKKNGGVLTRALADSALAAYK